MTEFYGFHKILVCLARFKKKTFVGSENMHLLHSYDVGCKGCSRKLKFIFMVILTLSMATIKISNGNL